MNYELLGILLTVVIQGLYVAYKMGKFEEKLNSLEKDQKKHNNLIERMTIAERDVAVLKEQVKVENHRIEDLEEVIR